MNRKVSHANFHVGYGHTARTGCNAERDRAELTVIPVGIQIKDEKGDEYIVPWSNVTWAKLAPVQPEVKHPAIVARGRAPTPQQQRHIDEL